MNRLMLGVAIGALTIGGALAQSPTAPNSTTETKPPAAAPATPGADASAGKSDRQPSATPESSAQSESGKSGSDSKAATSTGNAAAGGEARIVASQSPDQFLASSFEGMDVVGTDDEKIGDVADILFEKDGAIKAYVISFGGFLGMGAKEVAIAPAEFEVVQEGETKKLKLSMTQDDLKSAQAFAKYQAQRPATTTGAGGGIGGAPRPSGGMAPSGR